MAIRSPSSILLRQAQSSSRTRSSKRTSATSTGPCSARTSGDQCNGTGTPTSIALQRLGGWKHDERGSQREQCGLTDFETVIRRLSGSAIVARALSLVALPASCTGPPVSRRTLTWSTRETPANIGAPRRRTEDPTLPTCGARHRACPSTWNEATSGERTQLHADNRHWRHRPPGRDYRGRRLRFAAAPQSLEVEHLRLPMPMPGSARDSFAHETRCGTADETWRPSRSWKRCSRTALGRLGGDELAIRALRPQGSVALMNFLAGLRRALAARREARTLAKPLRRFVWVPDGCSVCSSPSHLLLVLGSPTRWRPRWHWMVGFVPRVARTGSDGVFAIPALRPGHRGGLAGRSGSSRGSAREPLSRNASPPGRNEKRSEMARTTTRVLARAVGEWPWHGKARKLAYHAAEAGLLSSS